MHTKKAIDDRGSLVETFLWTKVPEFECRQTNVVQNEDKKILRGIHAAPYQKLVTCPMGLVYDVCVDLRPGSMTYGKWHGQWLYASRAILIPAYCGHAYYSPSKSLVLYHLDDVWSPDREVVINAFDKGIDIWWPHSGTELSADDVVMSDRDRNAPPFCEFDFACMTI